MRYLLIDKILELEKGKRAVGIKNITMSEDIFAEHFPHCPVMPGALILEAVIQLGGWLIAVTEDFRMWALLKRVEQMKLRRIVVPGECLTVEVMLIEDLIILDLQMILNIIATEVW